MTNGDLQAARLLVIDDNEVNVALLEELLSLSGFSDVRSLTDSRLALTTILDWQPDLVLLDLHMPEVSGFDILRELGAALPPNSFLPVLACTADWTEGTRKQALKLGANDFITKPFDATELVLRVRNFLRMRQMHLQLGEQNRQLEGVVERRTRNLAIARSEALECLARAGEYRDDVTGEHANRVATLSALIARELGLNNATVELVRSAAPLHDLGKIGISDSILMKPGKLTCEEFETMKQHAALGASIIGQVKSPVLRKARLIAQNHHENWDGTGYPTGLKGNQIPLPARIVSVADTFDALVSARPYKAAWTMGEAIAEVRRLSGTRFDPDVVEAFVRAIGKISAVVEMEVADEPTPAPRTGALAKSQ